jgi:inosose dehydratase
VKIACHTRPWREDFPLAFQQAREAGFSAVETFCLTQWIPQPEAFHARLEEAGLVLAAMECGGEWTVPARAEAEWDGAERLARFLSSVGAEIMIASGGRRPPQGPPVRDFAALAHTLSRLGRLCADLGLRLCYHPREGSLVEYRDQIAIMMDAAPPDALSLCLDTGDLALTGSDPLEVLRAYGPRIGHVHLKDVDWNTHLPVPPGQGALNLGEFLGELRERDYPGWVTVEIERSGDPLNDARLSLRFVEDSFASVAGK